MAPRGRWKVRPSGPSGSCRALPRPWRCGPTPSGCNKEEWPWCGRKRRQRVGPNARTRLDAPPVVPQAGRTPGVRDAAPLRRALVPTPAETSAHEVVPRRAARGRLLAVAAVVLRGIAWNIACVVVGVVACAAAWFWGVGEKFRKRGPTPARLPRACATNAT